MPSRPFASLGRILAAGTLLLVLALPAHAIPPSLRAITPPGGARGSEVQVTLHGTDLREAQQVLFREPGISAGALESDGRKVTTTFTIAADARLGTHTVRVRTNEGVTNLWQFSVGALSEIEEAEPNSTAETPQAIARGTTVNGVVENEDVDYFAVNLEVGQRLAVEVEGLRLGGPLFDPKLRLFGPRGHELIAEDDTQLLRQDAALVHVAEEAGTFLVALSEAQYGGGGDHRYRLHVGEFPRPLGATPLGGQPGEQVEVTWLGDPGVATQTVTMPAADAGQQVVFASSETGISPTGHVVRVNDLARALEAEPNNKPEEATAAVAPGAFEGVIQEAGDVDFYTFSGTQGQRYNIRVWARDLGSPLDSVLRVLKPDGGQLEAADDTGGMDSAVRVELPADGDYLVQVYDHLRRGGEAFAYRIEATPIAPEFDLGLLDNDHVRVAVPQGNRAFVMAGVTRREFDGPIAIDFPGLPEGVTFETWPIPAGQTRAPVLFSAAPDAPLAGALTQMTGRWDEEGRDVTGALKQNVKLVGYRNNTTFFGRDVDRMATAVTVPAPFTLSVDTPPVPVVHGGAMYLTVRAERAEDFSAPIDLHVPWLPNKIGAGTAQIKQGETSAQLRIECYGGASVGEHRILVVGRARGYELATPFVSFEVQEPWVNFNIAKAVTEQGKPVEVEVTLNKRVDFEGDFEAVLHNLPNGVSTAPQPFTKDTEKLVFPLEVAEDARHGRHQQLMIRTAIALEGGSIDHTSARGELQIHQPLPPELQQAQQQPAEEEKKPDEPERKTRFPTT